jgi:hypothetical protein
MSSTLSVAGGVSSTEGWLRSLWACGPERCPWRRGWRGWRGWQDWRLAGLAVGGALARVTLHGGGVAPMSGGHKMGRNLHGTGWEREEWTRRAARATNGLHRRARGRKGALRRCPPTPAPLSARRPRLRQQLRLAAAGRPHELQHLAWPQAHMLVNAGRADGDGLGGLAREELGGGLVGRHKPQELLLAQHGATE